MILRNKTMLNKKYKESKGFTIFELIITIAIIGIVTSIIFSSLGTSKQKTRNNVRIGELDTLRAALTLYYDLNKTYPKTCRALDFYPGFTDRKYCPESNVLRGRNSWVGLCAYYNYNRVYPEDSGAVSQSGSTGWIAGLAPEYVTELPKEKYFTDGTICYLYSSDGEDYKVLAHKMVEGGTVPSNHAFYDPSGWARNTSYSIYTSGARLW